jgi:hypothetical protein
MRPRLLVPAVATLFLACGGTTGGVGTSALPGVDAGAGAASTSAGGVSSSSGAPGSGGATSAGGRTVVGSGGAAPSAGGSSATGGRLGAGGAGGAGIDCSNVGCGVPPICGQACGAPCGCCPCADGERNGPNVCLGGCYAPASDAGTACNPVAEEHRRKYIGSSPASCATIRFTCPAKTTAFSNACGCGCEQQANCPEWFNCQPTPVPPGCDTQQIEIDCPYSGIAL